MDFANALVEMANLDFEVLFVEASGLADPSNLEDIITGANSQCANEYVFTGSICIVDAINYLKLSTALPALESQVVHGDYILINKSDLADEDTLAATKDKLLFINANAKIYNTSYAKLPDLPDDELTLKPSSPSSNTPTTRPKTKILHPKPMDEKQLGNFINKISRKAYRAKGFITVDGQKKYLDIVGGSHTITPSDEKGADEVVLLTLKK